MPITRTQGYKIDDVFAGDSKALTVRRFAASMQLKRTMHPIVKQKHANHPGKLAAWISASTVEKAPSSPP